MTAAACLRTEDLSRRAIGRPGWLDASDPRHDARFLASLPDGRLIARLAEWLPAHPGNSRWHQILELEVAADQDGLRAALEIGVADGIGLQGFLHMHGTDGAPLAQPSGLASSAREITPGARRCA